MSPGDDISSVWLTIQVLENETMADDQHGETKEVLQKAKKIDPDWSLVLGEFKHVRDENFEAFLISVGVPYFLRGLISGSTPTVVVERIPYDDYYYDHDIKHYLDDEYMDFVDVEAKETEAYQIMITSSTFLSSHLEQFRPGYTFEKMDRDGTKSQNTYVFVAPSVLVQYKHKAAYSLTIIRVFDEEGSVTTIINKNTGLQAKRFFDRVN
ncbi:hypothetical protein Pcinc_035452 [Petrolisthes cinctipes]|uniref:Uncharacterized protein n=1 Tax=Petrolisthes cinctipes TaxID=88211 RepID=A0AAE1EPF0_PETCI|nr:hypothetical protein Pcinc_035452 [Petrolisthes cinctipes]